MQIVDKFKIQGVDTPKTQLWLSESASKEILHYVKKGDPQNRLLMLLKRWSTNGFQSYEGTKNPIRQEWDGIYRIGDYDSLFRIIGFYENDRRSDFIAIDAFMKKKQGLSAAERERINTVANVKRNSLWRKKQDEHYPRIAR